MSTRRIGLLLVCLTYLMPQGGAQVTSDPNDAALSVLKKPESADEQYLSKNAGAVALAHGPGKLLFQKRDGGKSAILGAVTHRNARLNIATSFQHGLGTGADDHAFGRRALVELSHVHVLGQFQLPRGADAADVAGGGRGVEHVELHVG